AACGAFGAGLGLHPAGDVGHACACGGLGEVEGLEFDVHVPISRQGVMQFTTALTLRTSLARDAPKRSAFRRLFPALLPTMTTNNGAVTRLCGIVMSTMRGPHASTTHGRHCCTTSSSCCRHTGWCGERHAAWFCPARDGAAHPAQDDARRRRRSHRGHLPGDGDVWAGECLPCAGSRHVRLV